MAVDFDFDFEPDFDVVVVVDFEPDLDVAVVVDFELGLAAGELPHDARTKAAKRSAMILPGNRLNLRIIDATFLLVGARNDCTSTIADEVSAVNGHLGHTVDSR
ncbi:hypothetical protein [Ferrimicrobium sp.]|uniref:hypothetical protein n=1 Tax=Ferrimicrobium sp. TaxID=2926050 RepID=UPI002634CE77|nr:hypothetical protein [Ferrimicrobium sp.]